MSFTLYSNILFPKKKKKTPFASNNYFNKVPHNKWIKSYLNAFEF